ncbi:MAG: DUF47 family protein [Calditrichaeota bacterium]|nr:DUF47 family protein [Calditrichota bacterium]
MLKFFTKTVALERKIDSYLDLAANSALHFKEGVIYYLNRRYDDFDQKFQIVNALEHQADDLRREIESELYQHTLIPESRGDVLALLETIDKVINRTKSTLLEFSVEQPEIPDEFVRDYTELTEKVVKCAEAIVMAMRAFFRDINAVRDHINKVIFYEEEADRIAERLKRKAFRTDLPLAKKFHLRYFALHIDSLADDSEDVADRLAIYTIKRSI